MPKLRNRDPDIERKLRIQAWLAAGMAMKGIRTYTDLAIKAGMQPRTLTRRREHPEDLRMSEIWAISRVIGEME